MENKFVNMEQDELFEPTTVIPYSELLIGGNTSRDKKLVVPEGSEHKEWQHLVTMDDNGLTDADVTWDMSSFGSLPFSAEQFDEIHMYDYFHKCGMQGDWRLFFHQFNEFYRILRKGGHIFITVPQWHSMWAWSDPAAKRIITQGTLYYLERCNYEDGKFAHTGYVEVYKGDFEVLGSEDVNNSTLFVLRKR